MKSLTKILRSKKISSQKDVAKFLVGKTVKIINKRNEHNYGKIGDSFQVDKIDNLVFNDDPHAQLKDYHNKIYLTDLELCKKNSKIEQIGKIINNNISCIGYQAIFKNILT